MILFDQIANKKWDMAQKITRKFIGDGKQEGKEYLFKNPFTLATSYGSFRFNPEKQIFMDMTQSGKDMHVTPEKFVAKLLQISEKEAWKLIKESLGEWVDYSQYKIQKQVQHPAPVEKTSKEVSFKEWTLNDSYLIRVAILISLIEQFKKDNSALKTCPVRVINFFKSRAYDIECVLKYADLFQVFNWSTIQEIRKIFTNKQFIQSGLMKQNLSFYWFGYNYSLIFPCWYTYFVENLNEYCWFVTGIRLRFTPENTPHQTTSNKDDKWEDASSKEVEIPLPEELKKLGYPSAVGWYGFKYWANTHPSVLNKCENLNVIIVEGICDMLAAMEIITVENTIIITTGILARNFHPANIDLISKCKTLFIAFDDDFSAKINTGQENAIALKKHLNTIGMNNVEILPKYFYQGKKDFNDLLRLIKNK